MIVRVRTLSSSALLVFGSLLGCTGALAQEEALTCFPPRPGVGLRAQPVGPGEGTLRLWADRVEGYRDRTITAYGSVNICRSGTSVVANKIDYSIASNSCDASGGVRLDRYGDLLHGTNLHYRFDTHTGKLDDVDYQLAHTPDRRYAPRGKAAQVDFVGPLQERMTRATYTTCDITQEDWVLNLHDLDLDRRTQIGVAHGATVRFFDVPILYTPYISFPLNDQRKSGFLAPTFGSTGTSGFEFTQPWYWNIAPNMDDTITPRYMSKRGLQLADEFRYLEPKFSGELSGEYLSHDALTGESRHFLSWQHRQNFGGGWTAAVNLQGASDDAYFRDLSTRLNTAVQTTLPRDVSLNYAGGPWVFRAEMERFQVLQDPLNPIAIPYSLGPQLALTGNWFNVRNVDINLTSEFTEFDHPTLVNGRRAIIYPSVSYPILFPGGFVTPKIGYHLTQYSIGDNNTQNVPTSIQRGLPIASVDSGLYFERELHIRDQPYTQTLEPRLFYVHIPFRDQSQIPNFSTALADFSFAQIFNENQYIGGDRVNDAEQLTAAVTSRLLDDNGEERIRALVGQRFYFKTQEVTLPGETPRQAGASDILLGLSDALSRQWSFDAGWQYSTFLHRTEQASVGFRYRPELGKVLNLGYRVRRDDPTPDNNIDEVDDSGQWPLSTHWYGLLRMDYSTQSHRPVEALAGLEYNKGCWTVRFVAHQFQTATDTRTTGIFLQLELNGLSKIGLNPLEVLKQNIPGYTKTDEVRP